MPTKPTPAPDPYTLAAARQLGATWLRYQGPHWALYDTPIWELYREHDGQLQRRLLGYPGGTWQRFDGVMPMDVMRVNESEVTE